MIARAFLLWPAIAMVAAVESAPVEVVRAVDGHTVLVRGTVGEQTMALPVRLLGVSSPPDAEAAEALARFLRPGRKVVLRAPGEALPSDAEGFPRAAVLRWTDPGTMPEPVGGVGAEATSIQERMVAEGLAVPDPQAGRPDDATAARLMAAAAQARDDRRGLWQKRGEWMSERLARAAAR